MARDTLLIATHNAGKAAEIGRIIGLSGLSLITLRDLNDADEIEETGTTFRANSEIKSTGYAKRWRIPTLADDSGLSIDHLGGRPGVLSARYAGPSAADADRIEKVLSEMKSAKDEMRSARFICAISLATENGEIVSTVEGQSEGAITNSARGSGGFGYDPIFQPVGFDKTFAELAPEIKNSISHRADAISKMIPFLRGFFEI
jgi:XTP/dITP diphosphohydrolase